MLPSSKHTLSLPVLDVRESSLATAQSLVNSVSKHGFVYIKNNHGEIPSEDIKNMFALVGFGYPRALLFASCSV
jgi:hypothetical protein